MSPIFGFLLYLAASGVVWIVASKRGRAGWIFFLACLVAGPVLVMFAGAASGGNGVAAALVAFMAPVVALVTAVSVQRADQKAVSTGEFGEFVKCKFCAESIRREAIKCKHCGSAVGEAAPG